MCLFVCPRFMHMRCIIPSAHSTHTHSCWVMPQKGAKMETQTACKYFKRIIMLATAKHGTHRYIGCKLSICIVRHGSVSTAPRRQYRLKNGDKHQASGPDGSELCIIMLHACAWVQHLLTFLHAKHVFCNSFFLFAFDCCIFACRLIHLTHSVCIYTAAISAFFWCAFWWEWHVVWAGPNVATSPETDDFTAWFFYGALKCVEIKENLRAGCVCVIQCVCTANWMHAIAWYYYFRSSQSLLHQVRRTVVPVRCRLTTHRISFGRRACGALVTQGAHYAGRIELIYVFKCTIRHSMLAHNQIARWHKTAAQ